MMICPCSSGKTIDECCGPFLVGVQSPETPEQLMRSRYTAYSMHQIDYIEKTMREPAAVDFKKEEALNWSKRVKWQGLEVIDAVTQKDKGFVEFKAHYIESGKSHTLHEISEFHFIDKQWYYIDGKKPVADNKVVKISRNEPCPCGSGKKYKKCCLNNI